MNWTPTEDHIYRLQQVVNHMTNRRACVMEAGYPLDIEQVKKIVWPPRLQEFAALGYDSLQTTRGINYELGPEHGLARRSITHVSLPKSIHYAYQRQLQSAYVVDKPIYFNRDGIDDIAMEALKKWTEEAVYERRLAMLTTTTVSMFFKHRADDKLTMYHILARWPGLKAIFPRVTHHGYGRAQDIWERHGNEVPRNLQRWDWPKFGPEALWRETNARRMALAEETLLSCLSLASSPTTNSGKLTAHIADWQILGGAPF